MEEHKIPTLTLTPDLDAAQPAAKEPDLLQKAEAAPEAGPDLSMLSPEEQQAVTAFAGQIDLTNANQVLQYGSAAQKNIADFSETALAKVKTSDMGQIGDMVAGLLVELKTLDEPEKKGIAGWFAKANKSIEETKAKYSIAEKNVDKIAGELENHMENTLDLLENRFRYPMFVKPAGTGSSVGVSKVGDRDALRSGLRYAGKYDKKILVEEFVNGKEIEVAVMGNDNPMASICGEIDSGAEFYDYDAKYLTETSKAYIPARIPAEVEEVVRETAVKVYNAVGCQGLSRVDFFVTHDENRVVFNEINTLPGFTSISMYPKLFEASGVPYSQLIDELLRLAVEAFR